MLTPSPLPLNSENIPPLSSRPTQRLFIALALPVAVRSVLAGLATRLREVRWTPVEQLHLTLRFLGDVPTASLDELVTRLTSVRVEPFILPVEGVGAFPQKGPPRVLWSGVGPGHPRMHQLRQRIDDTLLAIETEIDVRPFLPHVGLARCGEGAGPGSSQWLRAHREFTGPPFLVDAFELFASERGPATAVHRCLARFPLCK